MGFPLSFREVLCGVWDLAGGEVVVRASGLQVMGHCQAMLGMNAWVPTVRENGSRENLHLVTGGAGAAGLKADGGNVRPEAALECGPFAGREPRPRPEAHVHSDGDFTMTSNSKYRMQPHEEHVELGVGMERVQEAVAARPALYDGSSSVATSSL